MKKRLMLLLCVPFLLASCGEQAVEPQNNNPTQQTGENTGNTGNQGDNTQTSGNTGSTEDPNGNTQTGGNAGNQGNNTEVKTVSDILIEGYKNSFKINQEFSTDGLKVFALYSTGDKEEVTDYTVDSSKYNKQVSGDYEIVITYSGKSKTYNVNVSGEMELPFV